MRFNFLNYHTEYKVSVNKVYDNSYVDRRDLIARPAACFATFFRNAYNQSITDSEISIKVYYSEYRNSYLQNNMMLISRDDMLHYLDHLRKTVDFQYSIENEDELKGSFDILINSIGNTHFENKWIASSVRNIYEYPQSAALMEAINLKKHGFFPDEDNIINIFNVVLRTIISYLGEQCVSMFEGEASPLMLNLSMLKQRIDKLKLDPSSRLNDIYPLFAHTKEDRLVMDCRADMFSSFFQDRIINEPEFSNSKEDLKYRYLLIYKPIYNLIKPKQIYE